jgi:ribonuclease HI
MVTERRAHGRADMAEFRVRMEELRALFEPPHASGDFVAHTDGACFGNPDGPGGWAAVVDAADGRHWQLWGHLSSTSNNRAEALGVLGALEWLPAGSKLLVRSDSELTVKILQGLYKARANAEIWAEIRRVQAEKGLVLVTEWVRGHVGDPGNERADQLSKLGALNGDEARLGALETRPAKSVPSELVDVVPHGDWESQFLRSVSDQLRKGRSLSDKQRAIVDRMRARGSS